MRARHSAGERVAARITLSTGRARELSAGDLELIDVAVELGSRGPLFAALRMSIAAGVPVFTSRAEKKAWLCALEPTDQTAMLGIVSRIDKTHRALIVGLSAPDWSSLSADALRDLGDLDRYWDLPSAFVAFLPKTLYTYDKTYATVFGKFLRLFREGASRETIKRVMSTIQAWDMAVLSTKSVFVYTWIRDNLPADEARRLLPEPVAWFDHVKYTACVPMLDLLRTSRLYTDKELSGAAGWLMNHTLLSALHEKGVLDVEEALARGKASALRSAIRMDPVRNHLVRLGVTGVSP